MREDWVLGDFVHGANFEEFELIWEVMWPCPTHTTTFQTLLYNSTSEVASLHSARDSQRQRTHPA